MWNTFQNINFGIWSFLYFLVFLKTFNLYLILYTRYLILVSMFKDFLLKQMLKRQLKGMPEAEQDRIITIVTKNPELFQKIATEAQEHMKGGMDQQAAMKKVMGKYQDELKGIL